MKRLMKKARFFGADNMYNYEQGKDVYTEIFYNPTANEMQDTCKYEPRFMVRMLLNQNGDLYAWNGGVLHRELESQINGADDFIHIDYDGNARSIIFMYIGPSDEFVVIVKKAKKSFDRAGISGNTPISFGGYGSLGKLNNFKTLEDIYNL